MAKKKRKKPEFRRCDCGAILAGEDATFWGECDKCRLNLPIKTSQDGDGSGAATDREYHGDQFQRGEW